MSKEESVMVLMVQNEREGTERKGKEKKTKKS
jgi:hypothetical protein